MKAYDVIRNQPYQKEYERDYPVHLYSGSGRSGACFDAYGLMNRPFKSWVAGGMEANTVWMHGDHYVKGAFGLEHHVPLGRFHFEGEAPAIEKEYHQHLSLAEGRIETSYLAEGTKYALAAQFNPAQRDFLFYDIAYEGNGKAKNILFTPETILNIQYNSEIRGSAKAELKEKDLCRIALEIAGTKTVIYIRLFSGEDQAQLQCDDNGACRISLGQAGHAYIIAGACRKAREEELHRNLTAISCPLAYRESCTAAWKGRWGEAKISIPDKRLERFWYRSVYNILCTYSPDSDCIAPPNGWTGNGWGFHFPQDFSYILPALLRLGHHDIAKAKVEFYHKAIDSVKETTKRVYRADGAMWCWEFPIDSNFALYKKGSYEKAEITGEDFYGGEYGSPNDCQFEIHNAAYPARMAYETSLHLKDDAWSREIAWPIVKESANFYYSVLQKEEDGTWGIHVTPSMGQDENGGFNEKNYLCSLYSAQYALQTAIRMAEQLGIQEEKIGAWKEKLQDGLAFERLASPSKGIYLSCEKLAREDALSDLKHPVMLNPLIFLPLPEKVDGRVLKAYEIKEEICPATQKKYSPGWTLAAFWLAASHLGRGNDMLSYMHQMREYNYTDKEEIQITESSLLDRMQYYTTSHGLFLQALTDAIVNDYFGKLQIGGALPDAWEQVSYENLHTAQGCYSGVIKKRKA